MDLYAFCCFLSNLVFSDKNPQRRRLVERWHRYVLKDNKAHDDLYPDDPEKKAAGKLQTRLKNIVRGKTESSTVVETVKKEEVEVTPIVNPSLLKDQSKEEEMASEMQEVQEVQEVQEETKKEGEGEGGVWESITSTFWWLLGYKN